MSDAPPEVARRRILSAAALGAGGLAALGAGYPVARAILDPAFQAGGRGDWQAVGTLGDFPLGRTVLVTFTRPRAQSYAGAVKKDTAWVTRRGAGGQGGDWLALHNTCMHLGCPVQHQRGSGLYFCPCHGGVYDAEGVNVAGPPRIPLQRLGMRLRGEVVELRPAAQPLPTLVLPRLPEQSGPQPGLPAEERP
ncbi:Rieske 2Fe-2S domain-containing protein [uncultured Deinococcus sp.]|uniref:QcrA and Rieske domain-containing protein n=1 Tax=uncultured Deinococcus sp. TaxID=158789 RepID=UPI00258B638E|nr:Rieske 2Fe-2S domain-containing protein [uncultured Deinococcus sp.]